VTAPILRRATAADSDAIFDLFVAAVADLARRQGNPWDADRAGMRERLGPMLDHLATHAAEWWVAVDEDGVPIGYARSTARGGLFELTEFFVHPERQSAGIGAALLARAFPRGRGDVRVIIATTDVRAQARYYRAGTVARFPITSLEGAPRAVSDPEGVEIVRAGPHDVTALRRIEADVLEFDRGDDFLWLLGHREGWLYRRDDEPIGFAFVGPHHSGPIAVREPADQVPVLLHAEGRAAALGVESWSLEVPMVNEVAVRHLLDRGFHLDPFITFLMSSRPFGRFDRFIGFSPPFFL
jgi:GNAT superfamily N-acetyltransferase